VTYGPGQKVLFLSVGYSIFDLDRDLRGLNNGISYDLRGVVAIRSGNRLAGRRRGAAKSRKTSSITSRTTRKALAADGARITRNTVVFSIIALLSERLLPDTVSTASRCSTTTDDVWKTDGSIAEGLGADTNDVLSDGQGLETVHANGRVDGEGFVNAAAPVREGGVIERAESWGRGDDVSFVVAVEISTDLEVAEVGESIYGRGVDVIVVA
jgi:hypothetical protein